MESHQWVVLVQQSLEEPSESADDHIIYPRVPKSLKSKNTETSYIPEVISFGPYHFQEKNPLLDEIEVLKSEVARKYNNRLNGRLSIVVQEFMCEHALTRKIYGKEFPICIPSDLLSWMIVRDGYFLMEILHRFADVEKGDINGVEKEAYMELPNIDGVLGRKRYHPLLNAIVKDMFKMENQLPLWVLEKIVPEWSELWSDLDELPLRLKLALKNLSPIEVIIQDKISKYNEQHHILHMLHDYIVDKPVLNRAPNIDDSIVDYLVDKPPDLHNRLLSMIPDYGPSVLSIMNVIWRVVAFAFILLVLSPVVILYFAWFIINLIWGLYQTYITDKRGTEETYIPTVEELQNLGVKFKKLEGRGIYHTQFEERNCTLHLPKFKVDDRSEVILRNLMALEIDYGDVEKPITRYALLMNDLVNTSADVAILRHHDIITSKLGSDNDVAQLWNSVMVATEMPEYEPIDRAASKINGYRKKRLKILWAQFKMIHCSKPWLVLSLLGGTSLLMLTVVHVACLFRNCQI